MIKKSICLLSFLLTCTATQAKDNNKFVGGDISLLPSYEQYDTPYYDSEGKTISDVVTYLHDVCGWNACRVRLFVNPTEESTKVHTGVVQDLEYVTKLGKRIKEAGMQLMLDFHYSDSWADPAKQTIPASWKSDTSDKALEDSVYQYTSRCLNVLKEAGAEPDFVQVGNEVSYGMLWRNDKDKVFPNQAYASYETQWKRLSRLLNSGSKAVRQECPNAKIIIHTERSGSSQQTNNFYQYIKDVDYDIIGLSYYCFYHGALSELGKTLDDLESNFPEKEVQIVETAYFYQYYPNDVNYNYSSQWQATETGQLNYTSDLITELQKHDNVNGLYWWFAEENGNGGSKWDANKIVIDNWLNRGLWNDNNHKALQALYQLKSFAGNPEAISTISLFREDHSIYSISSGSRIQEQERLPHGLYVIDGKKVFR